MSDEADEYLRDVRRSSRRAAMEDDDRIRRKEADIHRMRSRRSMPIDPETMQPYVDPLDRKGNSMSASIRKMAIGEKPSSRGPLLRGLFKGGDPDDIYQTRNPHSRPPRRSNRDYDDEYDEPPRRNRRAPVDDYDDEGPSRRPRRSHRPEDDELEERPRPRRPRPSARDEEYEEPVDVPRRGGRSRYADVDYETEALARERRERERGPAIAGNRTRTVDVDYEGPALAREKAEKERRKAEKHMMDDDERPRRRRDGPPSHHRYADEEDEYDARPRRPRRRERDELEEDLPPRGGRERPPPRPSRGDRRPHPRDAEDEEEDLPPRPGRGRRQQPPPPYDDEEEEYAHPSVRSNKPPSSLERMEDAHRPSRGNRVAKLKEAQAEHRRRRHEEEEEEEEEQALDAVAHRRIDREKSRETREELEEELEEDEPPAPVPARPRRRMPTPDAEDDVRPPPAPRSAYMRPPAPTPSSREEDDDYEEEEAVKDPVSRRQRLKEDLAADSKSGFRLPPPDEQPKPRRSLVQSAQSHADSENEDEASSRDSSPPAAPVSRVPPKPKLASKPTPKPRGAPTVVNPEEEGDDASFLAAARANLRQRDEPPRPPQSRASSSPSPPPPSAASKPKPPKPVKAAKPKLDELSSVEPEPTFAMPKLRPRSTIDADDNDEEDEDEGVDAPHLRPPSPRKVSAAKPTEASQKLTDLRSSKPVTKPKPEIPEALQQRASLKPPKPVVKPRDPRAEAAEKLKNLKPRSQLEHESSDPNMRALTEQLRSLKPRRVAESDSEDDDEGPELGRRESVNSVSSQDSLHHPTKGRSKGPPRRLPTKQ